MDLDNHLSFALVVDQQVPVAVVKPRRQEIPHLEESFYLERALSPGGAENSQALQLTALTPERLAAEPWPSTR